MEEKILDSNVINEVVKLFKKSTKITVFTGAGISVSCGVPDFRSENGLYSTVGDKYNLPYPEAI
ncbi:MAG TPA: Sir2 family NAD-dependent protein deacetylase, partial [Spirochaetota bacterium]|nr:Sir2 family NAD-dependent protein deacetylase [Spirochaetota bacterium]